LSQYLPVRLLFQEQHTTTKVKYLAIFTTQNMINLMLLSDFLMRINSILEKCKLLQKLIITVYYIGNRSGELLPN